MSYKNSTVTNALKKGDFEGPVQEGFGIFTLFATLSDFSNHAKRRLDNLKFTPAEKRAYDFFN